MSNERLLIIDDSREVVKHLVEDVLPEFNYQAIYAYDGQSGLNLIREQKPDLILLDFHLPSMTGLDILQHMVEESINIPVILMTGYGSELSAVNAFRLGAKDYLVKPFTIDEITSMIDRALVEKRLQHDNERLTEEVRRLKAEMRRQANDLHTLFDIGKAITSFLTVRQVLSRVLDAAKELTQADEAHIWLPNQSRTKLFTFSEESGKPNADPDWSIDIEGSDLGQVFKTELPFRQSEYTHKKIQVSRNYAVRAIMAVPLKLGQTVVGLLTVSSSNQTVTFSQREQFLLSFLADYAAIAFENARIFQEADKALAARVEELNTLVEITQTITSSIEIEEVIKHTIQHVHESWDIEASSLWWLNESGDALHVLANVGTATQVLDTFEVPVGQGIVGKVVETGKWQYSNDIQSHKDHLKEVDQKTGFTTRSLLCVPLQFRGEVKGAMQLLNKRHQPFNDQDVERACSLAAVVAIAVMNAKNYHKIEEFPS